MRAMLDLAQGFGAAPVSTRAMAERQGLPRKYLHALLTALKSVGLVRSVRGPGGGFALTRSPAQISLGEILRAVEGPLSLVDCVADRRVCGRAERCTARRVWEELSDAIGEMLDSVTLEDLVAPGAKVRFRLNGRERGRPKERVSRKPTNRTSRKPCRTGVK